MSRLIIEGGGRLGGRVRVPGDKSISHRVLMLGAIAEGVTEVEGFLEAEDTLATLAAFRSLGVAVEHAGPGSLRIEGRGLHGLQAPPGALNLGNSGTSMRLLAGLLAGQTFDTILTGDASLTRRPMRRIITPLERMGGAISCTSEGTAPLVIRGGRSLRGIDYDLPIASAQVKSAVLLAGLYAEGPTRLREPAGSRDHTERMLRRFGAAIATEGGVVRLTPGRPLQATLVQIPADLSSAAFFLVGAAMSPGSDLVIEHVGLNPTRTGVLDLLRLMGADIEVSEVQTRPPGPTRVVSPSRTCGCAAALCAGSRSPSAWWRSPSTSFRRSSSPRPRPAGRPSCPAPKSCATRRAIASRPWREASERSGSRPARPPTAS